jgi:hypothetical protein
MYVTPATQDAIASRINRDVSDHQISRPPAGSRKPAIRIAVKAVCLIVKWQACRFAQIRPEGMRRRQKTLLPAMIKPLTGSRCTRHTDFKSFTLVTAFLGRFYRAIVENPGQGVGGNHPAINCASALKVAACFPAEKFFPNGQGLKGRKNHAQNPVAHEG